MRCWHDRKGDKVKTFKQKVARRWRWWAISTLLVLAVLLALGWAFLSLVDDVSRQVDYLTLVGAFLIVATYVLGQAVNNVLVRSWDTWIGDLGPTQVEVLIKEMSIHAASERENEKGNGKK